MNEKPRVCPPLPGTDHGNLSGSAAGFQLCPGSEAGLRRSTLGAEWSARNRWFRVFDNSSSMSLKILEAPKLSISFPILP